MSGALRIVVVAALLFGAIALGACGGDDAREERNAYVRELNAAQQEFATKLRGIDVPSVVREEHKQLIAALTSYGTDFQKVTGVLKNPSARTLSEAKSALTTATQRANARIEAAAAAIDSKLQAT